MSVRLKVNAFSKRGACASSRLVVGSRYWVFWCGRIKARDMVVVDAVDVDVVVVDDVR